MLLSLISEELTEAHMQLHDFSMGGHIWGFLHALHKWGINHCPNVSAGSYSCSTWKCKCQEMENLAQDKIYVKKIYKHLHTSQLHHCISQSYSVLVLMNWSHNNTFNLSTCLDLCPSFHSISKQSSDTRALM